MTLSGLPVAPPVSAKQRLSWLARAMKGVILWFYKRQGWTEVNASPGIQKCVIIAAPHTSNWDFIYFIGAAHHLGLPLRFVGKKQLFRWPFAQAMKDMGGVPVDRSQSTNFVEAMAQEFARRDTFMLTIAPEGTRGAVRQWKTGFYHIAMAAKVPLVLGMMDYKLKRVGLTEAIWPSGDYEADMKKVAAFYAQTTPKHPKKTRVDFGSLD